ncbi:aminotransferase class I/II-fold pyridoxal phosphate-dependent enzyme [Streptantibioticus silvisoli]|nr:aminotransferase class I/II-fold pyridoxal phosphate-dependent enzyme [Streptantibioticus silvisoli]MDI5963973.1 aminotransferase class I/II-fold pyridoxal phosphate-dependent enzyme [Streptantibioticus silvisoli]
MSALARRTGSVNLGQGFPDWNPPEPLLAAASHAISHGDHQYPPVRGLPELRRAVSADLALRCGIEVDPETEVVITAGATEGLTAAILALVGEGDEVVFPEPFYDAYPAAVTMAGGVPVTVPLTGPDYVLDEAGLAAAVSPRTRMILLNTPNNPTGRVLTRPELDAVARTAAAHDLIVLVDEVYEHLVYDGREHLSPAAVPGMRSRTLTVGSAAKTFSATGWKVGWVSGPAELVGAVARVKQYLSFATQGPLQTAVVAGLNLPASYFADLRGAMERRRDLLCAGLTAAGFAVTRPEGGYFVLADASGLGVTDAADYADWLARHGKVVAIPGGTYFTDARSGAHLLRFAFCKTDEALRTAVARLSGLRDIADAYRAPASRGRTP